MAPKLTLEARALVGKRVGITNTNPDTTYYIAFPKVERLSPDKLFRAKIVEYRLPPYEDPRWISTKMPMYLKVRVDAETQEKWGLDDPVLEWKDAPYQLPIYETVPRLDFAKGLAQVNAKKAHLPIELLGEIMSYEVPNARPGPHPGKERQAEYWKQEHARQSDEAVAAMKAGRSRRRRSLLRKTRRRN